LLEDWHLIDCLRNGLPLDQHVYVWDGSGNPLPGFPKKLSDPSIPGAEIITTAALGDISGDGKPDIVTPTQEFDDNPSAPQTPGGGAAGGFSNFLTNVLANVLGGSGRVYAVDRNGNTLPGWPTAPNGIVPDEIRLHAAERRLRRFPAAAHLAQAGDAFVGLDLDDGADEPPPVAAVGVPQRCFEWDGDGRRLDVGDLHELVGVVIF